ncbi:MAG TPA: HAMP domain-containing histidine kinase, partial [Planctomycetaceae bacterium]|nr:HAMP domain-containing histidine kinase [Planctomycetaceae bacterium]
RLPAERPGGAAWLIVLYPVRNWREDRWNAAWPPLAIGATTLVVMAIVSGWLAARLGRRIRSVQQLFARIAAGQFAHVSVPAPRDELSDLLVSANRLSDQLRQMQQTIRQTEQLRVLAQIAGGLAHQLRNDITGARMALELHRKRCGTAKGGESLQVALRQLVLTEDHVKAFLAFARRDRTARPVKADIRHVLVDLQSLLRPTCEHQGVELELTVELSDESATVPAADSVRVAIMNLVFNAIEAEGPGGYVRIHASRNGDTVRVEVIDTGPGPPSELQADLFEPFVTSKPEGVGLGLAIVRRVADELGGTLDWRRRDGQTVFALCWPVERGRRTEGKRLAPEGRPADVRDRTSP